VESKTDQPYVGRAAERAGAGRTLGRRASAARIRATIEELLADGPHRAAAAGLGAEIRAQDGRRGGADLLEGLTLGGADRPLRP